MATNNALNNQVVSANFTINAGSLLLPTTSSTVGQIKINSVAVFHTFGTSNTFVGQGSGNFTLTTGSAFQNSALGHNTLTALTSGANNTAFGNGAGKVIDAGSNNCCIGTSSGFAINSGIQNTLVGVSSAASITTGGSNTIIGFQAGSNYTSSEGSNIIIGSNVLGTAAESNTIRIGNDGTGTDQQSRIFTAGALTSARAITATTGNITALSGNLALPTTTSTVGQIIINGTRAFHQANAQSNTFVGNGSGNFTLGGVAISTLGAFTCPSISSANFVTAVGYAAGLTITTGANNTLIGADAGGNGSTGITTGTDNICIGYNSGSNYTSSESSNIIIGSQVSGTVGESNVIRIGTQGSGTAQQNKCFIAGITGVTVVGTAVLCSTTGALGTVASSEKVKENIQDMASSSDAILKLRPVTFNFKSDEAKSTSYGLIAEEVLEIFPDLVLLNEAKEPYSIKYHEMPSMLLNELQKALKRIEILESKMGVV